jgi:hypothetical protein
MNGLIYAAPSNVIDEVLDTLAPRAAAREGAKNALAGAAAGVLEAAIGEAWGKFRSVVERCVREGYEAVRAEIVAFSRYVDDAAQELGVRAEEFRQQVLAKIRETIVATFDALLRCMRSTVSLGSHRYVLDAITLEQKLVYSGSLEASLTALCKFVGGGELVVTGSYKLENPRSTDTTKGSEPA